MYFTEEFAEMESDVEGYAATMVSEANEAYANSGVKITLRLHCLEILDVAEDNDGLVMLKRFAEARDDLLGSADVAFLLVSALDSNVCGIAYLDTVTSPFGVAQHKCARGHTLTFAHEASHILGADHNEEVSGRSANNEYAYGYLVRGEAGDEGVRTVMAYYRAGFRRKISYFSSSKIKYKGKAIGDAKHDNAKKLNEGRFGLANVGDERKTCGTELYGPYTYTEYRLNELVLMQSQLTAATALGPPGRVPCRAENRP